MEILPKNTLESTANSMDSKLIEIRKKAGASFRRYMENTWKNLEKNHRTLNSLIPLFIKNIKENIALLVPEATNVSSEVDNVLNSLTTKKSLIDGALELTIQTTAIHLSLKELEGRLREKHLSIPGIHALSRVLSCIIDSARNRANLHIPVTFLEDQKSVVQLFKKGLETLAQKVKTEEEFKKIIEVRGYSSLIKDNFRLLKSLGFSITLDKNGKPTEEAIMSKGKLLELYGK